MSEGFPGKLQDQPATDVGAEHHDLEYGDSGSASTERSNPPAEKSIEEKTDEFIQNTYGLSTEEASREITWGTKTSTLRQLLLDPPKAGGCPIDFGANFKKAHQEDPHNGAKNQIGMMATFGAHIGQPTKARLVESKPNLPQTIALSKPDLSKKN